ncbi:hypothetical protein E5676_scaffold546G001950 [Cucumis melo var. makuwa]|uniref:Uncharacterized protein n=1 Tax=Cucumis melo var. makuwa TaxID=1194695 RepID=A0A5A7VJE6_CUCMM|nr:hypothetical protein E6C27_scaffold37G001000 [Cucumis melo var. makuwa]TYJ96540.1 hypothetical protein E5676_scaffold546G001950 [Cucumis melo var. makuwa]
MIILFSSRRTKGTTGLLSSDPPPGRSDQTPSSCGEVVLPSAIQLLSGGTIKILPSDPPPGDDRAFTVRSIALIHRPGRSDRAPSSFGEVILPSAIQLLLGDDRAFAVKSTVLVEAIGHLRHLERWGDIAVSDPTSIGGRSGFCRQIHRPGRSDRTPSSFGEVILPSAIQLLSEDDQAFAVRSTVLVEAIGHHRRLERWRQNCTIDVFLEKQRGGKATSTPMKPKVFKLA